MSSAAPAHAFLEFRRTLLQWILIAALAASFILKYLNVLVAGASSDSPALGDVAGLLLVKLASSVSWESAREIGMIASLAAAAAIFLTLLIARLRVGAYRGAGYPEPNLPLEVKVYGLLLAATAILGVAGLEAATTMAALNFGPLLVFALLNPLWRSRARGWRVFAAIAVGVSTFVLSGSKTTVFTLVMAFTLLALFHGRTKLSILIVFPFLLLYPYLNVYRGASTVVSSDLALAFTVGKFLDDFTASGIGGIFTAAYSSILNRLVGLDGLLAATTLNEVNDMPGESIGYLLLGFDGVGVSVSMMGQLLMNLKSLPLVALLYPLVVAGTWRFVIALDDHMIRLGFASFGTFLYIKAVQVLVGGFRPVDMLLMGATIFALLSAGIFLHVLRPGHRVRNQRI